MAAKTVEQTYLKKTQREHILLRPDTTVGQVEQGSSTQWVIEEGCAAQRELVYSPALYKIYDEIIVNACDRRAVDPTMTTLSVDIDQDAGTPCPLCLGYNNNGMGWWVS
jgi:DNA topoisomerase-2